MISNNGRTFVSAAQTIERVLMSSEVQQHLAGLKVKWNFNLEKAPWWGDFLRENISEAMSKESIGKAKLT